MENRTEFAQVVIFFSEGCVRGYAEEKKIKHFKSKYGADFIYPVTIYLVAHKLKIHTVRQIGWIMCDFPQ